MRDNLALAQHVLDAYDNVDGHAAALKAMLPREPTSPVPALIVAGALSTMSTVGCVGTYGEDRWETQETPTDVRAHSGALGTALVMCVFQPRAEPLRGYDLLWPQIKMARGRVGSTSPAGEAAQLCATASALMACQDGETWKSPLDYQDRMGGGPEVCARIIEAVDARRDSTWATALSKTVPAEPKAEEK